MTHELFSCFICQAEWMAPEVLRNEPSDEKYAVLFEVVLAVCFICLHSVAMLKPVFATLGVMFIALELYYGSYVPCSSHGKE